MFSFNSSDIVDDSFSDSIRRKEYDTGNSGDDTISSSAALGGEIVEESYSSSINKFTDNEDSILDDNKQLPATSLEKISSSENMKNNYKSRTRKITSDSEDEGPALTTDHVNTSYRKKKFFDSDEDDDVCSEKDDSKENFYDAVFLKSEKTLSSFNSLNESLESEQNKSSVNKLLNKSINAKSNESYREVVETVSSDSETEADIIPVSSDDEVQEVPWTEINVNDIKNRLKPSLHLPSINTVLKNISSEEKMKPLNESDNEYYCSAAEYSNQATKVSNLRTDTLKCKNALRTVNLNALPDKGVILKERQSNLEKKLALEEKILKRMVVDTRNNVTEKQISWDQLVQNSACVMPKTFGKTAMNTYTVQKTLTMDRLKNLHGSLATCPDENTFAEDPKGLKIELMPHQKHALAWLTWREEQKPRGGILADDMGLGKTLTMISLILQTKGMDIKDQNSDSEKENEEENYYKNSKFNFGGTLVICPASLIRQWESEIEKRLKRGLLSVELYHGVNRENNSRRLSKFDVVITTYKLAQGEFEKKGPLCNIKWKRIILDEAHVIRNHKSRTSVAICGLSAKSRWALTGTPVHNKELDLFALLKFLRCSPFDDLGIWKQWVANKTTGGQDRLNTVITSILLRRTKAQLQDQGSLKDLPEKKFEEIHVELDAAEKQIYEKVLLFSRSMFIEFLRQREEKNPDLAYFNSKTTENDKCMENDKYSALHKKILKMHVGSDVKSHDILVLLLRLRQICCHPSLIHSMLDTENCETDGIEEAGVDIDLFEKLNNLNLGETEEENTTVKLESFNAAANKLLSSSNPVFKVDRPNEKLLTIKRIVEEKVIANDDKIIIVSQWTSMLDIIYRFLRKSIKCEILDGKVPVPKRNEIVVNFNNPNTSVKVLLLSLTAGGVGLNLVGANHLLLVDLHWNPQLESQAQDRIYRVGQKKTVHIYKIITTDTIEEKIKSLQDKKLEMAGNILSGARAGAGVKLSLDDLKMLFSIGGTQPAQNGAKN